MSVVTLVGAKPCLREQLAHQLDGRRPVSTTLDQDLEDLALVVEATPQIHVLARDPDDHFVEMPAIARSRTAPSQAPSDCRSEFEHPTANALVERGQGRARQATLRHRDSLG